MGRRGQMKMASNKRMIDIEREINDFFASEEFKQLALWRAYLMAMDR